MLTVNQQRAQGGLAAPGGKATMDWLRQNGLGLAGVVGVVAFASALVALHLIGPAVDWTRRYVSEFANGPSGSAFVLAAAVHGVGNLSLSVGLRRSLGAGPLTTTAAVLFGLAAAGIVAAALFPTDSGPLLRTASGLVHRVAATVSFPAELIALFLFSTAFAAHPCWRRWARMSFAGSATAAVMLLWLLLSVLWQHMPGLAERLALATFMVWELGAAVQLLLASSAKGRTGSPWE